MDIQAEWNEKRLKALAVIEAAGLDKHPDVMAWTSILPDRDRFFNSLTDTIPFLVYIYDLQSANFIFFNRQFIEFIGYTRDELYAMGTDGFAILCHAEDMPNLLAFRQEIEDAKDNEVVELGYRLVCKSGESFWLHSKIKIISRNEDGKVTQFMGVSQDISQIKEIENLLIRQENLYRSVLEFIPADIAVLDLEGNYRYVNPSGTKDPDLRKWMLGKNDTALFEYKGRDPERSLQRIEAFSTAIRDKKSVQFEEEWPNQDGSIQSTLRSYYPVLDAQANILMVIGYGIDISARRAAERSMRQKENRYKYLVENGSDIFFQMDLDGNFTFANPRASELTEYSFDTLMSMNLLEIVHPDYVEMVKSAYRQIGNQSVYLEFPIITFNGSLKWIGQNIQVYQEDNGENCLHSLARDITEFKQILAQLEEKKLRLEEALNIGKIGSFDLYVDSEELVWSEQTYLIFGFDPENKPTRQQVWERIHPEDLAKTKAAVTDTIRTQEPYELEYRFFDQDGSIKYIITRGKPIFKNGVIERISGTVIDVSVRRQAEELSNKAKLLAEDAIKTKEIFLAKISHELKTPLHGIVGMSHLLLETVLNEQQLKFAQAIQESSKNLEFVLNDILDFSKMEAGKMTLESIPFDLAKVVQWVVNAQSYQANEKGIELKVLPLPAITSYLIGDPHRLGQILQNLLNNAIKFTDTGSVILTVSILSQHGKQLKLRLAVKDSGIGIRPEQMDLIFEDFVQASEDTTRLYGGTGLGLAICKHLTELMQGSLTVESTLGKGSQFMLEIPFQITDYIPETTGTIHLEEGNEAYRILLVDDNQVNLLITQTMLEKHGFNVELANDGMEAIRILQQESFDLILMDIQMPVMDGIETTFKIRNSEITGMNQVPIIAISAQQLPDINSKIIENGINAYLEKPFTEFELLQKIENIFNRKLPIPVLEKPIEIIKSPALYSWDKLNQIGNGDSDFIIKMGALYLSTISTNLAQLEDAFMNGDKEQIKFIIHKMKPGIQHFDMEIIGQLLEEIKIEIEQNTSETSLAKKFELLKQHLKSINQAIRRDLDKFPVQLNINPIS